MWYALLYKQQTFYACSRVFVLNLWHQNKTLLHVIAWFNKTSKVIEKYFFTQTGQLAQALTKLHYSAVIAESILYESIQTLVPQ